MLVLQLMTDFAIMEYFVVNLALNQNNFVMGITTVEIGKCYKHALRKNTVRVFLFYNI